MSTRIVVGMSGGVDSSVAALLLKEQGYEVECLFMKNWEEDDTDDTCSAEYDYIDALQVCDQLDLSLHSINFSQQYLEQVFEHFLSEYRAGRTPNPDVLCNKTIKFKVFLEYALNLGAEYIATGHYARITRDNGNYKLRKGLDTGKDQSYFLYLLGQYELSRSIFPVGAMEKPDVRKIATEAGLTTHNKKDSTGICFIGERNFRKFLQHYIPAQPGDIVTTEGHIAGKHEGLMYYTLGQRKGLGVGGGHGDKEAPWYVVDKDLEKNHLIIAQGHDHPLLYSTSLTAGHLHWTTSKAPELPARLKAKTRYRQTDQSCILDSIIDGIASVLFDDPQFAVTPGQSVVFYKGDECIGGGTIETRSVNHQL